MEGGEQGRAGGSLKVFQKKMFMCGSPIPTSSNSNPKNGIK
jgi:hypothetical protein